MASRVPKSFLWFLATGVIFLLQVAPALGIFMMMLGAPFWSVLTVNAAVIGTGWEAATGRVSRGWLILPLLWFGGYESAALVSHWRLHALDRELARHNEARTLGFDPARHALVIRSDDDELSYAPRALVQSTALPVAYVPRNDLAGASHLALRLASTESCDRIRDDPVRRNVGIQALPVHDGGRRIEGLCRLQAPQDPALPVFEVTGTSERFEDPILPHRIVTIRIKDPSGRESTLKAGRAEPLGWIPLPIVGCFIGPSKWDCAATFYRPANRGLGGSRGGERGAIAALSEALGLAPTPAGSRRDRIADASAAELDRIVTVQTEASLARFDRMIESGEARLTVHDVAGLKERPDLLGPRAEKMADAMVEAARGGQATREKAKVLGGLLAMLPPADFRRVQARLLRLYDDGPIPSGSPDRDALITRLGDLGPSALPMLERHIGSDWNANGSAILGLCRVGIPAAGTADRVAAVLKATRRSGGSPAHSAAYVALLRMGRADLADSDPDSASPYRKADYEAVRRSVGPSSPPHVCVDDWGLPKLPDSPVR